MNIQEQNMPYSIAKTMLSQGLDNAPLWGWKPSSLAIMAYQSQAYCEFVSKHFMRRPSQAAGFCLDICQRRCGHRRA